AWMGDRAESTPPASNFGRSQVATPAAEGEDTHVVHLYRAGRFSRATCERRRFNRRVGVCLWDHGHAWAAYDRAALLQAAYTHLEEVTRAQPLAWPPQVSLPARPLAGSARPVDADQDRRWPAEVERVGAPEDAGTEA
ncbi:MAG TPA: hypothetical protein VE152_08020, partial [Acidimicrobiales bacterium]|nr:hypothetical protein [Acidimicrobiales bacterium]